MARRVLYATVALMFAGTLALILGEEREREERRAAFFNAVLNPDTTLIVSYQGQKCQVVSGDKIAQTIGIRKGAGLVLTIDARPYIKTFPVPDEKVKPLASKVSFLDYSTNKKELEELEQKLATRRE